MANRELSQEQKTALFERLKKRFDKNTYRHKDLDWATVELKLQAQDSMGKLWSLNEMENTGGEPDVVDYDKTSNECIFYDCSPQSPDGRRSLCYDRAGLESRKENRPRDNAVDMAAAMGIELLSEEEYIKLQSLQLNGNKFDTKTSSWIKTPEEVRKLGGALFSDYRFGRVFVYHNGAQSYYGGRGFRGCLRI